MNAQASMTALALLLLVADADVPLALGQAQLPLARNEVAFYVATHGEVRPEQDPQVANAHRVFERVRAVADKNSRRLPRLVNRRIKGQGRLSLL